MSLRWLILLDFNYDIKIYLACFFSMYLYLYINNSVLSSFNVI